MAGAEGGDRQDGATAADPGGVPLRDGDERRGALLRHIGVRGTAHLDELAGLFGVSRMTIHRDLDTLAAQGLVRRVRGGATAQPSVLFESNFSYRRALHADHKRLLAAAVAEEIEPGMAVVLDDSTTSDAVVPYLAARTPLTLITSALGAIEAAKGLSGLTLIALGGEYCPTFNAFLGLVAEQAMAAMRADLLIMSASAMRGTVAYHQDQRVVRVKRAMMAAADRRVLVIDSSKFGKSALHRLADLDEFDRVYVDRALPRDNAARMEEAGIRLRLV
jgi:DeoR/GlpR family transcriptional regulator of sugar metabolism